MRGRKPCPIEIAPDDLPLLQQIAHSQTRPWYQVRRARILLGIAHGARTQILAFLTQSLSHKGNIRGLSIVAMG